VAHIDVDKLFHYKVPNDMMLHMGQRVWVPFGMGKKLILGYVIDFSDKLPEDISPEKIKEIASICDNYPVLTKANLALAFWMKEKYYTSLAACIRCIIPSSKSDGQFPGTRRKIKTPSNGETSTVRLTPDQQNAINAILKKTKDGEKNPTPILLHGVTGSGKTEVYLHAIADLISQGWQAIVLVPEIALTPQMVSLFTARFGSAVAVTHSRLTTGERFQIWKQALDGEISLIIGPRSAVFTPFDRLGLIIIDEEHEHSYHSEITPKYDARAVAIKRGEIANAVVVLGSATPSLDSYLKTTIDANNAYTLIKMPTRINQTFPNVQIIDMRRELASGNPSLFSNAFKIALAETLSKGEQAILFLNRRGHSSFISCRQCGFVMSCDHCRVNYTYHQGAKSGRLLCHYCGRGLPMPTQCPVCTSIYIKQYGAGTQKVEEEVETLFPGTKTLRMDMDTTRGKQGHVKILDSFRSGEASVLVGTQMVAKGLDFPKVTLVCVVMADLSLFTGDFRAGEYTFSLLTQVAGRAGRSFGVTGQVFIQTYNPEHYALELAKKADYEAFYNHEITLRKTMQYPPFSHIFCIMVSGLEEKKVIQVLRKLWSIIEYCNTKMTHPCELLGISPAFVSKIKNQFRWKIIIKHPDEAPLKAFVLYCIKKLRENDPLAGMTIHLSLNPVMLD